MKKILWLGLMATLVSGCVPKSQLKKERDRGYDAAMVDCRMSQDKLGVRLDQVNDDLRAKNERLRKFNQLNADGTLRFANSCFDHPTQPGCEGTVTGKESWQK